MYQALAIKWRPKQFDQVVGQKHVTTTLANAIKLKRLGHAYLFAGPRGIGKTTLARIFAKGLNCLSSDEPVAVPCDKCDSCLEIAAGNSIDVMEIDGASNNSVDDVRQLRENVKYAPSRSRNKIYIIDEVHMLSGSAFNALLKTLEEPPPHVKFFFATTDPQKLPDTIISRCQRFDLRKISRFQIAERLQQILEAEKIPYEKEALLAVAAAAEGGMRDAESLLDQLLVYCEKEIRRQDVAALLGLVPREVVTDCSRAILAQDLSRIVTLVGKVIEQGWDVPQFLGSLVRHFRDLLVLEVAGPEKNLTDTPPEEIEEARKLSAEFTRSRLLGILNSLIREENRIKNTLSEQIALEMTLIEVARSRGRVYIDDLIARVEELASAIPEGPAAAGSPPAAPAVDSSPQRKEEVTVPADPPGERDTEAANPSPPCSIKEAWPGFLETLGANRPMLKAYLVQGVPREIEDGVVTITFREEFDFHREALEDSPKRSYMENLLSNKVGLPVRLAFQVETGGPAPQDRPLPASTPPPRKGSLIRDNPLIEAALDKFDGTVIDVKE
ncbi:MAG: DNA polymerase III subunit gamma/tau [Candidatus Erginobacter occultus]|nr:DNA polymerase III subunit gamma/tau [Candidatus Erginobacter occultus]